jgi:hypothetical protein
MRMRILYTLLLAATAVKAAPAAGWITITNDTPNAVIVQSTCTLNNQVRKGKPIKLMPGETLREFQSCGGSKTVVVSEPGLLGKQLLKTDLQLTGEDEKFALKADRTGHKLAAVEEKAEIAAKIPPKK